MDFGQLERDLRSAHLTQMTLRRRRGRRRLVIAAATLTVAVASGATAALLGAPENVRRDIAGVDQGLPPEIRLNPDAEHARAVVSTGNATLYAADLAGGGYCIDIVNSAGVGRGVTCLTAADVAAQAIEVMLPLPTSTGDHAGGRLIVGGRVNVNGAATIRVRSSDSGELGTTNPSTDGYFLFESSNDSFGSAFGEIQIGAETRAGTVLATATVPADWDDPPVPDSEQALYVSTLSDQSDFTIVRGIEGVVGDPGAVALELRYDDGTRVEIPLSSQRTYRYDIPAERQQSFMSVQTLVALDASGTVVAERPVAAVAYWRQRERSTP